MEHLDNNQIRTIVYEDNELLRDSLTSMLASGPGIVVAGDFKNPVDVEKHLIELQPDIILMDIDMPLVNGIEGVRKIRAKTKDVPVIMLTVFDDNQHVFDAICAGASGYLLKKHIPTKLFDSIMEVLDGGAPMSPSIARMVISSMHRKNADPNPYQLTAREKEVLSSLSKGNSYKLIAAEFSVSIDTIRSHIKKIYEKLQVHSQTEAVSKAINEGLV